MSRSDIFGVVQGVENGKAATVAACEEAVGIRVTSYGLSNGIRSIMNALSEDEGRMIQESIFGKFVSIAEQLLYSFFYICFSLFFSSFFFFKREKSPKNK